MKKIVTIAAIAAFATLAACSKEAETVDVPVNEAAAADVQLNDDGTVATDAATEDAAGQAAVDATAPK